MQHCRHLFIPAKAAPAGQSLVEFVLVMPILVLVLLGGFSFGMGAYQAHMASDAIQMPAMEKLELSNQTGAVNGGMLQQYVTASNLGGSFKSGTLLDNITLTPADDYNSIMVGTKAFNSSLNFLPGFQIRVAQVINRNLVEAASAGAETRPFGQTWIPGGTPVEPPWLAATEGEAAEDPAAPATTNP